MSETNGTFFVLATGDNFARFIPKYMAAMGGSAPDIDAAMRACAEHGKKILEAPPH
ncbi:MAG: hypothetical protein HYR64_00720 [Fimbriimonas ginsengisoli]|uniref:Uncharacterized protein n=1 Tax=Fimbriimonas ginsengisoli TaxID=1005039 RepID=A0A931LQS8_FIMGI|nr:hypothetical protein [Fimbriimonas ginsengisoli]